MAQDACHCRCHAKQTWHFDRISSLRSSAPPGPPENIEPACFPSSGPQTETKLKKKKSRNVRPKSPSLNVVLLQQQPPATTAVRPAGRPTVTVPEFTGAFPAVPDSYFHCYVLHPHTSNPWEPLYFGTGPETFCLAVSFLFICFFPLPLLFC